MGMTYFESFIFASVEKWMVKFIHMLIHNSMCELLIIFYIYLINMNYVYLNGGKYISFLMGKVENKNYVSPISPWYNSPN